MSLEYATDQLTSAVRSLASSEHPLAERLQLAWDEHVQMLWMKPCLTLKLLGEFRDLWRLYTAPSDDRRSTALRGLSEAELVQAVNDLITLWNHTVVAGAVAGDEVKLATLADLG
jgi:hypothetical protein